MSNNPEIINYSITLDNSKLKTSVGEAITMLKSVGKVITDTQGILDNAIRETTTKTTEDTKKKVDILAKLFSDTSKNTVSSMNALARKSENMLDYAKTGEYKADNKFGLSEDNFYNLKENKGGAADKVAADIANLKNKAKDADTVFEKFGNSFKNVFNAESSTERKAAVKSFNEQADQVKALGNMVSGVFTGLGEGFGSEAMKSIGQGVKIATDVFAGAMAGFATGGIVGGVLGLASTLSSALAKLHDSRNESKIQALQVEIDDLLRSYKFLGEEANKSYSFDKSKDIKGQNKMLEQQKKLVQEQMELEKDKKSKDEKKIKNYENSIEDINRTIAKNKALAQDAIFGEDVSKAIDNFATAWANAWASGGNKAAAMKDVVKQMIKNVIMQMLKEDLSTTVQKFRDRIEMALSDGKISDYEQQDLDRMVEDAMIGADEKYEWANKYMESGKARSATSKGFASMSQDSADELNGRFTQIQTHTYEMNENVKHLQQNSETVLILLSGIENNTSYCRRLESIERDMGAVRGSLDIINTKGIIIKS